MPEISRFFGIVISMNFDDHSPPHFHIKYGGKEAVFGLTTFSITRGRLSPRVIGMVTEWALLNKQELFENWELARQMKPLKKIKPLD